MSAGYSHIDHNAGGNKGFSDLQVAPSHLPIVRSQDYSTLEPIKHGSSVYGKERRPSTGQGQDQNDKSRRRICGLRKAVFWSLLALLTIALVVGGVVGGVVGAAVTKNGSRSTSPTVTVTKTSPASSSASALPIPTSGVSQLYCSNQTTYHTPSGSKYLSYGQVNWARNDITQRWSATFKDCMNDCDKYNQAFGGDGCKAVTYNANLMSADEFTDGHGNWFLKSAADDGDTGLPDGFAPILIASALKE